MRSLVLDTFCKKDLEKVRQAKFAGAVGHMISEEMRELASGLCTGHPAVGSLHMEKINEVSL